MKFADLEIQSGRDNLISLKKMHEREKYTKTNLATCQRLKMVINPKHILAIKRFVHTSCKQEDKDEKPGQSWVFFLPSFSIKFITLHL